MTPADVLIINIGVVAVAMIFGSIASIVHLQSRRESLAILRGR